MLLLCLFRVSSDSGRDSYASESYSLDMVDFDVVLGSVEEVNVVRHFPRCVHDDLPGIPSVREVEFTIDLLLGTGPISLTSYRMASAEIRELKFSCKNWLIRI